MAEAPITSPGPIMASQFFQVNFGASISSATFQRGICFEPGWGATYSWAELFGDSDCGCAAFPCSIDIAFFLIRNYGDMINDKCAAVKEENVTLRALRRRWDFKSPFGPCGRSAS
jgi:hypothetical protein